ncbi:MAG: hypothetical protein DYG89_27075 [Caldilinea sp. CFX5]|nr:hypothetical protein [Caldilinea sp. CFX5]
MAFDASGQWLAILRPNSVEIQSLRFVLARVWFPFAFLWPPTTVHSLPTTEKGVLAFRPQGDLLAIGTPNGWQLRRSKDLSLAMEQTENPITALAFSDDGCYVAFGEKSGAVQVWRMFQ